jgi:hypothetical protein
MSTRSSPDNARPCHAGKPQRQIGLSFPNLPEDGDDDWDGLEPNPSGDEIWEPGPFEFDDEEEPEPEYGDFWPDPDDRRDDE